MPSARMLIQDALYQRIPQHSTYQPPKATLGSALRIDMLTSRGQPLPITAQAAAEQPTAQPEAQPTFPRKPHLNDLAALQAARPILPQPPIPRANLTNVLRDMDRATGNKPLISR